jgi:hypothetical protein
VIAFQRGDNQMRIWTLCARETFDSVREHPVSDLTTVLAIKLNCLNNNWLLAELHIVCLVPQLRNCK